MRTRGHVPNHHALLGVALALAMSCCSGSDGGRGPDADAADHVPGEVAGEVAGEIAAEVAAEVAADAVAEAVADAEVEGPPDTPTCDPSKVTPPAAGCPEGLVPTLVWCFTDEPANVGQNWLCDTPGAEGELCKDGMYYDARPCAEGLECRIELYVSRCREAAARVPCAGAGDCPDGQRCFALLPGGGTAFYCAPGHELWQECTANDGAGEPGATAAEIQGSCVAGLRCMNGDATGDFAFCLPAACATHADCPASPWGWTAGCVAEADAGPGRVGGCAVVAEPGQPCAYGGTPHNGQACRDDGACGPAAADGTRICE